MPVPEGKMNLQEGSRATSGEKSQAPEGTETVKVNSTVYTSDRLSDETAVEDVTQQMNNHREDEAKELQYLHGLQLVIVTASITLVVFLTMLDTSIIATAVPRITDQFHSLRDVGWYAGAYQLGNAGFQPLSGRLYTLFNHKWTFLAFFAWFEFGSLLCGVATSSSMLIIGRAVAGSGASGLVNGAVTIIASLVPLHERAKLMGIMLGFMQLGPVLGPLVGGVFTDRVSWRWCFYINLPIGALVAGFLFTIRIPDHVQKPAPRTVLPKLHRHLDPVGFALLASASIQLLLALQFGGGQFAWESSTVIGLFCGSGATAVVWGYWNYRMGDAAMIPLSLIRKRVVWSAALTQMFYFTNHFLQAFFLPIYFQAVKGKNPLMAGVSLLPNILSQITAGIAAGFLVGRLGYYLPFSLASATLASVGVGLLTTLKPNTSTGMWTGFQILAGFGRGLGTQMPILAMQTGVKPAEISLGMSFLSFSQAMGVSIFLVLGNTIFNEKLKSGLAVYAPRADAQAIIDAGATAYRAIVRTEDLPGVLVAYSKSVDSTFYLATAATIVTFFTAWGLGWVDVRKKKVQGKSEA